ncbi:hypothetical protein Afil01_22600 [Actinorhabdospora filicis]|uniref:DUF397 domain-containing protein n=1 Tax=Actinorhabdospora filicis TaxID=1785913 RepID=A0A9W6W8Y3_9ACTN|nr:DUF397 domain-containing protein [Actinorhabdospora filicis]GLZ77453.1 hypothetical protein Afil01_22600 [Actinorhabdospora filicis]
MKRIFSTPITTPIWRKSKRSYANNACVEVAVLGHAVGVRDSKVDPAVGAIVPFETAAWAGFVAEIKSGRFDG